jgi:hypothetical protein
VNDLVVAKVDKARQLLAECVEPADFKRVADVGRAIKVYAQRQKLGEEACRHAHTVVIDAMRGLGEVLKEGPKNRGARGSKVTGSKREPVKDDRPTLQNLGIDKRTSSQAQAIATIAEEDPPFFEHVRSGQRTVVEATAEVARRKHGGPEAVKKVPVTVKTVPAGPEAVKKIPVNVKTVPHDDGVSIEEYLGRLRGNIEGTLEALRRDLQPKVWKEWARQNREPIRRLQKAWQKLDVEFLENRGTVDILGSGVDAVIFLCKHYIDPKNLKSVADIVDTLRAAEVPKGQDFARRLLALTEEELEDLAERLRERPGRR